MADTTDRSVYIGWLPQLTWAGAMLLGIGYLALGLTVVRTWNSNVPNWLTIQPIPAALTFMVGGLLLSAFGVIVVSTI